MSSTLTNPIQNHLSSIFQQHAEAINAKFIERVQEVVMLERENRDEAIRAERAEREKREEALRKELKAEREEALNVEREKREEALRKELKAEREKREEALNAEREEREEALKAEREKWKEALKVEKEKRELERADASQKYDILRSHLLEVEETTLDTAGWITNNVCHCLVTCT
jgi:hypothetical protein